MVTGDGGLPDSPMPWAYESTTAGVTRSGVVSAKKRQSIRRVRLDGALRAGAVALLDEEGVEGLVPRGWLRWAGRGGEWSCEDLR